MTAARFVEKNCWGSLFRHFPSITKKSVTQVSRSKTQTKQQTTQRNGEDSTAEGGSHSDRRASTPVRMRNPNQAALPEQVEIDSKYSKTAGTVRGNNVGVQARVEI